MYRYWQRSLEQQ